MANERKKNHAQQVSQKLFSTNANGTQNLPNNVLAQVQKFSAANFMLSKSGLRKPFFSFSFLFDESENCPVCGTKSGQSGERCLCSRPYTSPAQRNSGIYVPGLPRGHCFTLPFVQRQGIRQDSEVASWWHLLLPFLGLGEVALELEKKGR